MLKKIVVARLIVTESHDVDVRCELPSAEWWVTSCNDVLHKTVVVDLDLPNDVVEVGQVQVDMQDVLVEDERIDERLEGTLDELAILDADEVVQWQHWW